MNTTLPPNTSLCRYTNEAVYYRERDLAGELLGGSCDWVGLMMEHILGRKVASTEVAVMNAVLTVLMEHGLTPSAISSRLVYMSAPENLQGAVAAGLMAVGSSFVGTMENCAALLDQLLDCDDDEHRRRRAREIVEDHRRRRCPLPGFGHHLHRPDDPRAARLLELAESWQLPGRHVAVLRLLGEELDRAAGRHLTINATGAIAALLGEIGVPAQLMRGFAVISRAAGLVAHIAEEQRKPSGREIWRLVDEGIPYEPEPLAGSS